MGQGRCEQRSEVFVKIKKKTFFGGSGCGEGVMMDENQEFKFFVKLKKKNWGGGSGWGYRHGGIGGVFGLVGSGWM